MPRYRRKKADPLELLPPIMGLFALGVFFSPAFRQLLGALFYLVFWLSILAVVGVVAWAIWRRWGRGPSTEVNDLPPVAGTTQPATYRAADGLINLAPSKQARPVWTQELLSQLEWKRFEDVVAAYSRALGYEAKTTRIGADGGVDVQLFQNGQPNPVMIIQCKAWDAYKVGVKAVRELYGVMAADKVPNGGFFTTGEFTSEAEAWARDKNLDLVDGREFLNRIRQLPAAAQDELIDLATAGDYTTPTCPSCGVKMVTRTASKGPSEGRGFYGCRNYPRCRQTFKIPQAT